MVRDSGLNLDRVHETFESSTDFTIGLEEEFALLDPETLDLVPLFEQLYEAALADPILADSAAGELISSEIEIRSGRAENFRQAIELQEERRARLVSLAAEQGIALATMGVHPWADYREQEIIDTPHYRRVRDELQWVARRNNTWSMHLHMGIRGADRAIAVCDHLRELLPLLLALSANSPYLEGEDTGLDSVRTQIFTRTFPRCGVPEAFGDWRSYADFIDLLRRTGSIVESTQLWWSVRPHHAFGTVELRVCDAQPTGARSTAMAAVIAATIAQVALDYDRYGYAGGGGEAPFGPGAGAPLKGREIEENFWRAIRYGLTGSMVDFRTGSTVATAELVERLVAWTAPACAKLGIELEIPARNAATEFRARVEEAGSLRAAYRLAADDTSIGYGGREPLTSGSGNSNRRGEES